MVWYMSENQEELSFSNSKSMHSKNRKMVESFSRLLMIAAEDETQ